LVKIWPAFVFLSGYWSIKRFLLHVCFVLTVNVVIGNFSNPRIRWYLSYFYCCWCFS